MVQLSADTWVRFSIWMVLGRSCYLEFGSPGFVGCGYGNALSPFLQLNVLFISFLMTSSQRLLSQCFQIYTFSLFFFPFVFFSVVLRTQPRPQTCYPRPLSLSHVPSPSDASFHLSPTDPGVHIDSVFYNLWMRKWSPQLFVTTHPYPAV